MNTTHAHQMVNAVVSNVRCFTCKDSFSAKKLYVFLSASEKKSEWF